MTSGDSSGGSRRPRLVPRYEGQGYGPTEVAKRRAWVEERTGARLDHVGAMSFDPEAARGNVENLIGSAQMPLGVAGPLLVAGEAARGVFYVPLATTEGALVRSYERGMLALTREGGAEVRVERDENTIAPLFAFASVGAAAAFVRWLPDRFEALRRAAESTTSHGRLLALEPHQAGRDVIVRFRYATGDAHGMNMIAKATDAACRALAEDAGDGFAGYQIFSGIASEKRASGALLAGGKGKKVTAGARVGRATAEAVLHASPERLVEMWHRTVVGHLHSGSIGYNGHVANGLTALFIATGQDVANVANSAVAITDFELTGDGDLYASVTLPALTVATVGGGTALGTGRECLEMLGCFGPGKAVRLAEIAAATVLAGELSMGGAIASGEFVAAHEAYGRNRPEPRR